MARTDDAALLAEQMTQILRHDGGRPHTLGQLATRANPEAGPALILKAAKKKPFAEAAVVLNAKDLNSPVAPREQTAFLLRSPQAFLFLLKSACSPHKPAVEISKLRLKLPLSLRNAWDEVLEQRLAGELPPEAGLIQQGKKRLLHWKAFPLPRRPEEALAERALEHLAACREAGRYPLTLETLQRAVDPAASAPLWKKAVAAVKQRVMVSMKQPRAPVALREDGAVLVDSDLLLRTALELARSAGNHALGGADLKKKVVRELQAPFAAALERRRLEGRVPPGIGMVLQRKMALFFLLDDVIASSGARAGNDVAAAGPEACASGLVADFRAGFDAAFADLDRRRGGHNFVSLVDLRAALPAPRTQFDRELRELRRAGRYTLSAAEGRHGIRPEEQTAAVQEDGALLLYVSRRR